MESDKLTDPGIVIFQGNKPLQPGKVELHGFVSDVTGKLFGRSLEEVKTDWRKVSNQIKEMVESVVPEIPTGFNFDTIEVSLGFSAEGRLVFIAEVGVEASVSLTFKRADPAPSRPNS